MYDRCIPVVCFWIIIHLPLADWVWSSIGPVRSDCVAPECIAQLKSSVVDCVQPQNPPLSNVHMSSKPVSYSSNDFNIYIVDRSFMQKYLTIS